MESYRQQALELKPNLEQEKTAGLKVETDIISCKVSELGINYLYTHLFDKLFSTLPLDAGSLEMLKSLISIRMSLPKRMIAKESGKHGMKLEINKIYRMMDKLDDGFIENAKSTIFNITESLLKDSDSINILFYDLTTIYFENNSKSDLKQNGFSKDGKSHHVQVTLAMIVTKSGLPLGYKTFPGNSFEGNSFIPTLLKMREKYKINTVTIVADSAMLSKENIAFLEKNNFKYIISARIKNMSKVITKEILTKENYNRVFDIDCKEIQMENKKLVACFCEQKQKKDAIEREENIEIW